MPQNFSVMEAETEKLEFWKKKGVITVIPAALLFYTDYFVTNANSSFVVQNEKGYAIKKGNEIDYSDQIIFKAPSSKELKIKLEESLRLLRKMQQADNLLNQISKQIMDSVMKDAKNRAIEHIRRMIFTPKIEIFSAINSIFDMLKFETSDLALNQLRTGNITETIRLMERKREIENE
ncbi:MAG: hypothetical protein C0175_05550 [Caldisericum exile]|jgi:hypothetical protein|uniref:Uncharacterized protein n=1 Tax=Caldisericum exile TaxID=693075 RepID=A0A2J6X4Q1_9BACT|nr:MAG: hypothetical protein C0175_05550 [Caldisericum exile]